MDQPSNNPTSSNLSLLAHLLLLTAFAISYTQSPLYTSNQNTYFLHGLANAGLGFLSLDWMAGTTDPFPLFTFLISSTHTLASPLLFHAYYIALLCIFAFSVTNISRISSADQYGRTKYILLFTSVLFVCSGVFKLAGTPISNIMEAGVAEQYILGRVFQPSMFGVFLLLSIYLFLRDKPMIAVLFLGVSANFHPTYLLSAAALTASYMVILSLEDGSWRRALRVGGLSLVIVAPVVAYAFAAFGPTSPASMAQAQDILVNYRIPHHAKVEAWWSGSALASLGIVVSATVVLRKSRLWLVILIPLVVAVGLTLIQVLTGSKFLALLFPWRISTFLIPVCSFCLLGKLIESICTRYDSFCGRHNRSICRCLYSLIVALSVCGIFITYDRHEGHGSGDIVSVMDHVKRGGERRHVYMVPPRGGMERFRLHTGARILVDEKTHPYRDTEVVEWYTRLGVAKRFYASHGTSRCGDLEEASRRYGVTHVLLAGEEDALTCDSWRRTFRDSAHSIYTNESPRPAQTERL